jgi:hypothetical protein
MSKHGGKVERSCFGNIKVALFDLILQVRIVFLKEEVMKLRPEG